MFSLTLLRINVQEFFGRLYWPLANRLLICCDCGRMLVPEGSPRWTHQWIKLKNPSRWICHHCESHKFDYEVCETSLNPEQWKMWVDKENDELKKTFKNDPWE